MTFSRAGRKDKHGEMVVLMRKVKLGLRRRQAIHEGFCVTGSWHSDCSVNMYRQMHTGMNEISGTYVKFWQ